MELEEAAADIRVCALLLAKKIERLEKEKSVYMWDEVIAYFEGRRKEANK